MQNNEFGKRTKYPETIDPVEERRSGRSSMGIMVALALALALGLMFWSLADNDRVASDTAPGVTTGSSTNAPSPSNPPPMKGAGESSSTR